MSTDIDRMLAKEKDPILARHLTKQVQQLQAKIAALQRTNLRLKEHQDMVSHLKDGSIPNGCKPFSVSWENELLDKLCVPTDMEVNYVLGTTLTIREAKRRAYVHHMCVQKQLDEILLQAQRVSLRKETTWAAFLANCTAHPISNDDWMHLDLDLDQASLPPLVDTAALELRARSLYLKSIDAAAVSRAEEERKRADEEKQRVAMLEKWPSSLRQNFLIRRLPLR